MLSLSWLPIYFPNCGLWWYQKQLSLSLFQSMWYDTVSGTALNLLPGSKSFQRIYIFSSYKKGRGRTGDGPLVCWAEDSNQSLYKISSVFGLIYWVCTLQNWVLNCLQTGLSVITGCKSPNFVSSTRVLDQRTSYFKFSFKVSSNYAIFLFHG